MLRTCKRSYENTAILLKPSAFSQPLEKEIDISTKTDVKHKITKIWKTDVFIALRFKRVKIRPSPISFDCKTVVFGRFRVILACETREPHTPASLTILPRRFFTRSRPFVRIWSSARVRKKRLFCSLQFLAISSGC